MSKILTKERRTMSMGIKRGSIGIHKKLGIGYIGGSSKGTVAFYDLRTGSRMKQRCKKEDIRILTNNNWKTQFLLRDKPVGFLVEGSCH